MEYYILRLTNNQKYLFFIRDNFSDKFHTQSQTIHVSYFVSSLEFIWQEIKEHGDKQEPSF